MRKKDDMTLKRTFATAAMAVFCALLSWAEPYCDIRKFSILDGLAANSISDLKQASDNLMWFATWNGLSYYDGYSFHTFRDAPNGQDILSTNRIEAIYPNTTNDIWCLTSDHHVYVYDTHLCSFVNVGADLEQIFGIEIRVRGIYCLKNKVTWLVLENTDYIIRIPEDTYLMEGNPELIKVGKNGFRGGNIWYIRLDPKGREWILSDKGAYIYNKKFSTPLPFKWIREVGNDIFFATADGKLAIYDNHNRFSMLPLPAGVTRINELKHTRYQLLVATDQGVVIYNPRNFTSELINVQSPSQPVAEVKKMYVDAKGLIWCFTEGQGVTIVNPETGAKSWLYADAENPADRTTSDNFFIMQDEHNTLWVIPNQGTFCYFDRKTGQLVPYLLRSNSSGNYRIPHISRFLVSDQGILWVTGRQDLTQINFKYHTYKLDKFDGVDTQVRALLLGSRGRNWTGFYNGCLKLSDKNHEKIGYLTPDGQLSPAPVQFSPHGIYALYEDTHRRYWIGTKGDGLYLFADGKVQHFTCDAADPLSLPSNNIYDVCQDRKGNIWVATYGGGLALVREQEGRVFFLNRRKGLNWFKDSKFAKTRTIDCTANGEVLVGTVDGLVTFSDNVTDFSKLKLYTSQHRQDDTSSLWANDVNSVLVRRDGKVSVTTLGGTLQRVEQKNLLADNLKFDNNEQMDPNEGIVQGLVEDNRGCIWVIRESSIDKYDPVTHKMEVYGANDFDLNMTFTEAKPIHDPATDDITVGTPMGSLTFNPVTLTKTDYQPRIVFTTLRYNGEPESVPILHCKKLEIPANKRNLSISFAALDYTRRYRTYYSYRIDGMTPEGEWISLGGSNVLSFNRIPHGNYIIKVKATNTHGVWGKYIAELPVTVNPTFWESVWGRGLIFLLICGILAGVFYSYNSRQREKMNHDLSVMKNEFFSDASHKLRTPLALIGGPVTTVLDKEQNLSEESRNLLKIVQRNAKEMLEMLNKILKFDNNANFYTNDGLQAIGSGASAAAVVAGDTVDDANAKQYLEEIKADETAEQGSKDEKKDKDFTILVVEDNADLRQFLYTILHPQYNILMAENGKVGLSMARKMVPDFILTDVTMPVMDGITMIHNIKQDPDISHIPIIILSAKASVEDQLKGFEEGIDGYLTKPFSGTYLKGRIEAAINRRSTLQQEILKKIEEQDNQMLLTTRNPFQQQLEQAALRKENGGQAAPARTLQLGEPGEERSILNITIKDKTTEKILRFITENMANPDLKIDDIAQAMGMSRSVLYGKIKTAVGMTPIDFVRHIRIMRATELLRQTDDTLANIAFTVGFSDPKYFSKVFKKEMGIIPSEFRERTK